MVHFRKAWASDYHTSQEPDERSGPLKMLLRWFVRFSNGRAIGKPGHKFVQNSNVSGIQLSSFQIPAVLTVKIKNFAGGYENDCLLIRQNDSSYFMVSPTQQQTRYSNKASIWYRRYLDTRPVRILNII
jgi:hypothetical protein